MFSFSSILERIAPSLFLFAASLFAVLLLSFALLLPAMSRLEVAGTVLNIGDIRRTVVTLKEQVEELESERDALLLPMHDPLYLSLKEEKDQSPFPSFLTELREIRHAVRSEGDVIDISSLEYDGKGDLLILIGTVQSKGPHSMTVLARFLTELSKLSSIESMDMPAFTREENAEGGFTSPFDVTLKFRAEPSHL